MSSPTRTTAGTPAVAYYRVSTARQGASGLGLEAQQAAVAELVNREGLDLIAAFTEVESGRKADRPKLAAALDHCRKANATLIVAKLDRLARNVHFLSGLMEAGVDFRAVDLPEANAFTLHVLAAVAEHEARAISERTKAGLAAARARGVKLGSPKGFAPGVRELGPKARTEQARRAYAPAVIDLVCTLREAGWSYRRIARRLDQNGTRSPSGRPWVPMTVRAIVLRHCEETSA